MNERSKKNSSQQLHYYYTRRAQLSSLLLDFWRVIAIDGNRPKTKLNGKQLLHCTFTHQWYPLFHSLSHSHMRPHDDDDEVTHRHRTSSTTLNVTNILINGCVFGVRLTFASFDSTQITNSRTKIRISYFPFGAIPFE